MIFRQEGSYVWVMNKISNFTFCQLKKKLKMNAKEKWDAKKLLKKGNIKKINKNQM